jgi:hypothetical protein
MLHLIGGDKNLQDKYNEVENPRPVVKNPYINLSK